MSSKNFETHDMHAVIADIRKQELHRALLRLWLALYDDSPRLERAEALHDLDSGTHRAVKDGLGEILVSGNHLKLGDLNPEHDLAFLQALDEFLWLRYDATGRSPPVRLELGGRAWFLHRQVTDASGKSSLATRSGSLQFWCRYHWVVPHKVGGFQVNLVQAPDSLCSKLEAALRAGELRIAIASFDDTVIPAWEEHQPPICRATTLTDEARRGESIRATLDRAFREGAQIVVLPELTVTPSLVDAVRIWLDDHSSPPFLALVPGSFHRLMDGVLYNYAELLDGYGQTLIAHRKLIPFRDREEIGSPETKEGIATGDRIELLDTPAGLIAMPICLDFCEENHPFGNLWEILGIEWLLVPAFGDASSVDTHLKQARKLQRIHGAVCALANQPRSERQGAEGFICHDGRSELEREVDGFLCVSVSIVRLPS
ncbi:MAG: nitrilase-related carbon-nitrogen hydrolase [bacterium]